MYRHIKSYEVKYTDVDVYDNLKLSSLLAFAEESACLSADELGFGYTELSKKHLGFIIANYYIKLDRRIKLGDVISIHTWPLKPKLMIFLRDSEIYIGNEKVGVITARWCMINTETFSLVPASAFFGNDDFIEYNTERSIKFNTWKIPAIENGVEKYSKIVAYSDCDHYFHMNNTKYADLIMDVFSIRELKNKILDSVQITYVKQCIEGEKIDFKLLPDGDYFIVEGRVGEELRMQSRIKFADV